MALVTKKDGSVASKFTVTDEDGIGTIEVYGDEVRLSLGKATTLKKNYVSGVIKKDSLALNKVSVELLYYDLFGNRESKEFSMAENDYRALKNLLGK